jgi:hypothetical protein
MNLNNYYLDLNKVSKLDKESQRRIHDYYRDMIYTKQEKRDEISESLFNTLWHCGFLIDIRNEKLENILNEDNSINS